MFKQPLWVYRARQRTDALTSGEDSTAEFPCGNSLPQRVALAGQNHKLEIGAWQFPGVWGKEWDYRGDTQLCAWRNDTFPFPLCHG